MANRSKIKAMAKELNLQTIVKGKLIELGMGNLDYLEMMLSGEIENRRQNSIAKARRNSNLPNTMFDKSLLQPTAKHQVEKLLDCIWIRNTRNLLIIGEPSTGKTALACYLTGNAIEKGYRAFYIKAEEMLEVLKRKQELPKAQATFNKIKNADLLVLDEVLYLDIGKEDLELLYKTVMFLNDTTSIVFITNREVSDWIETTEDKYTMQLLIKRAIENSELLRMRKN